MLNPHPPLSSFPFVITVLLLLAELFSIRSENTERWESISRFLVLALCLALPLTYFSGYLGADFSHRQFEVPDDAVLHHQLWAKLSLLLGVLPALLFFLSLAVPAERPAVRARLRIFYRLALGALCLLLARTSFLGGELVFSHGAGVAVSGQNGPQK